MDRLDKGRCTLMYESPIDVVYGQVQMDFEDNVMKAVQNYGINVNKDELISALMYDRRQYEKGYQDAKEEFKESLTFDEIKDIVLSIDCKELETHFVKGEILGMCIRKIAEKTKSGEFEISGQILNKRGLKND